MNRGATQFFLLSRCKNRGRIQYIFSQDAMPPKRHGTLANLPGPTNGFKWTTAYLRRPTHSPYNSSGFNSGTSINLIQSSPAKLLIAGCLALKEQANDPSLYSLLVNGVMRMVRNWAMPPSDCTPTGPESTGTLVT